MSLEGENTPIGPFKEIIIARSTDEMIKEKAQYGGSVTALLIYALEKGLIESAILTDRGNEISPTGTIARNRDDILSCAGSRYTASAGLAALNRAAKNNEKKLGVVGLPCQMEVLAKTKRMEPDGKERSDLLSLKIGLFCTWALDYRKIDTYLQDIWIRGTIKKYDIPPPPSQLFHIRTEKGLTELPLEDIRPFILKGCSLCQDMTAEWADLSVGTVEGMEGWNTVIVRNDLGSTLIDGAVKDNILEIDSLPEENFNHLKEASLNKRNRGVQAKEELDLEKS